MAGLLYSAAIQTSSLQGISVKRNAFTSSVRVRTVSTHACSVSAKSLQMDFESESKMIIADLKWSVWIICRAAQGRNGCAL